MVECSSQPVPRALDCQVLATLPGVSNLETMDTHLSASVTQPRRGAVDRMLLREGVVNATLGIRVGLAAALVATIQPA
jgi:hypothetical protein